MTVCECFTDDQLKAFQRAFNHFDKKKNNVMDFDDLPKALKLVGILPTADELQSMKQDVGDSPLDLLEFISLIYYFLRGADTREELIKAFSVFDEDHDGKIPVDEAVQILSNLKHPVPREQIDEIMATLNKNNDNLIDYAKMIEILRPE